MNYAIITGTSRGLGESVAKYFLDLNINVIGISRSANKTLSTIAEEKGVTYHHYSCNLADPEMVEDTLNKIKTCLEEVKLHKLYIVNNAGIVSPIHQARNIETNELTNHFQINVIAPMTVTNHLLNFATKQDVKLIGVTISSGAAERPISGWSAYCSSKASINTYTKTVGLEEEALQSGHKVIAFSPGIMDTEMQAEIRSSSKEDFKDVETFQTYKDQNHLQDVDTVGKILIHILTNESAIVNGKIYYVSDYT